MERFQLEHVIRAAADATGEMEIVVVGSQAILGSIPNPPEELTQSMEADVFPKRRPDLAAQIDGNLGEFSMFHETYGYYAHGVGPETIKGPQGWQDRLVAKGANDQKAARREGSAWRNTTSCWLRRPRAGSVTGTSWRRPCGTRS